MSGMDSLIERYSAMHTTEAPEPEPDGEAYARAILCRRRRKCIAQGYHAEGGGCPACGT